MNVRGNSGAINGSCGFNGYKLQMHVYIQKNWRGVLG